MTKNRRSLTKNRRSLTRSKTKRRTRRSGRNPDGTFAEGNPGGPGRPRRAVEREYLAALSDALLLDDWREIVGKAIEDAKDGDAKAREWVSRYALGAAPISLHELAAREVLGIEADYEVAAEADKIKNPGEEELLSDMLSPSVLRRALRLAAWMLEEQDAQGERAKAGEPDSVE